MKKIFYTALIAIFVIPFYAIAQDQTAPAPAPGVTVLKIAAGSSSGIYEEFEKEMQAEIGDSVQLVPVESHSATQNLDHLMGNDVNLALMTADVLFFRKSVDDTSGLRTLLVLFPEDINIVTLNQPYKLPKTGPFDFSNKTIDIETITDLDGQLIGTAGGGFITSNIIKQQAKINWDIQKFNSGGDALSALRQGQIAAVLLVGAAPLPALKDLGSDYRLVSVPDNVIMALASVYKKHNITYNNISAIPVQTLSAPCLVVTRNYKSRKNIAALLKVRQAIINGLPDLQETTGNHKAWQLVDPQEHGTFPWFTGDPDSEDTNAKPVVANQ